MLMCLQSCSLAVLLSTSSLLCCKLSCSPAVRYHNGSTMQDFVWLLRLSPAGGWGPGILQDCMTGQSTWVCSGLPLEVCKLRLEEYGVNIFRAIVGSSSNSISLGRTPELLVFGLRVCVGLGFSDRSLGLGFRSSRVVFRRFNLLGYIGCLKNRHFKPQSPEASVI